MLVDFRRALGGSWRACPDSALHKQKGQLANEPSGSFHLSLPPQPSHPEACPLRSLKASTPRCVPAPSSWMA